MPINFQQIRAAIQKFGETAPTQAKLREKNLATALRQLDEFNQELEVLGQLLDTALAANPDLRIAIPTHETLDLSPAVHLPPPACVLLAADGSQIIPDQHQALQFGVINVGMLRMQPGSIPSEHIESELLYAEKILNEQGFLLGEELIALQRDYQERRHLLNAAELEEQPVLTLTDGPLEIYREGRESAEYQRLLDDYLDTLGKMAHQGVLTAGYVDKPRSNLVVRLLELTLLPADKLREAGRERPLPDIPDAYLFAHTLAPGQRSALFQLHSRSAQHFQGPLAIHFFYLNIGREGKPQIARVEIPAWVVQQPENIALIHAHLLDQCQVMGANAYPYILHRAHELALVSYSEREHLLTLLQQTLLNQGLDMGAKSSKQTLKDLQGKTRYRR